MQTGKGGKGERGGKWDKDDEDEEEHEDEDEDEDKERGGGESVRMRGGFEPAHWHWHCAFTHDENLMVGSCGVSQRRLATTRSRVRGVSFPRATSEGFSLCRSTAGAKMSDPAGSGIHPDSIRTASAQHPHNRI